MERDFNEWILTLKSSISSYDYYVNFEKVFYNVEKIIIELNIMNSLIGKVDIENEFTLLVEKYPEVLKCVPILLAVRSHEIYAMDADGEFLYNFQKPNLTLEQYCIFMRKTGLFNLIKNKIVSNLVDYVLGIETGLDSNGRKNRGGHLMENVVESYIKKFNNLVYYKEIRLSDFQNICGIDCSAISNNGKTEKRFDFIVKSNQKYFLIETNFYATSGSKLNETARSYKNLAIEARSIPNVEFVWITDGEGWNNARYNLLETFESMSHLYNINDLNNGALDTLFNSMEENND